MPLAMFGLDHLEQHVRGLDCYQLAACSLLTTGLTSCSCLQDYGELETSIRAVLSQRGLQQPADFVTKVVQMYDTMCVRFGMMLVGPTGGGKTSCYRTLQGALTRLRKDVNSTNEQYQVSMVGNLGEAKMINREMQHWGCTAQAGAENAATRLVNQQLASPGNFQGHKVASQLEHQLW